MTAAYGAQGLGYAVVVTSLPSFTGRLGIDDVALSLIVLLVCATAAGGSVVADVLARWRGSRTALGAGLILQAAAFVAIALGRPLPVFVAAFGVYGLGLGAVDASAAMQGVLVQRRYGRDIMGAFFAAYTAAAIAGALLVAGSAAVFGGDVALGPALALGTAAVLALAVAASGTRAFERARAAAPVGERPRIPLPRRGIWLFGFVILVAFTLDSGVSTWSTIYLNDDLLAGAAIAPLGYAAYQVAILVTRLMTDRATGRWGRTAVVVTATTVSIVGMVLVAALPWTIAVIVGFALAGVAVGALVPLAFTSAGALAPARGDEVIARVNLFNYAGAVLGAVLLGLLADAPGLGVAFLLPALLLVPILFLARRFGRAVAAAEASVGDAAFADGTDPSR
ncbi:MAG: MFS transporter [Microbacterium sp.]|nr:MFS transporter [Microbacterium sp.]MDO8382262.1 MFS transporter [Microbacterium sp.]